MCLSQPGLPSQNTTGWMALTAVTSHTSGGCTSKIKVPAGLIPRESSFSGTQMVAFSRSPRMAARASSALSSLASPRDLI